MTALNPDVKPETQPTQAKVEQPAQAPEVKANEQATPTPTEEDPNWKAFREARKQDRAQREAAEARARDKEAEAAALKAAMEALVSKPGPTPSAYQQYYGMQQGAEEDTEEQRIEKKVNDILTAREVRYKQEAAAKEAQELPNKLSQTYPDFNTIVSQENLDYLDYHYPEVSRPLQRLHDDFSKWTDIYNAVKRFVPNTTNAKLDSQKAEANQMKPKSISTPGVTPPGEKSLESWQSIEQRRAVRYAEMQRIAKGL